MELSRRLKTVADELVCNTTVADIGTDHAYIPIYLLETGRVQKVIAMDVREGPLERAKQNIYAHKLEKKTELRRSDGLAKLCEAEADALIIAGMGGALISRILREGEHFFVREKELILQPQSEIYKVRRQLHEMKYRIVSEKMLVEDGKFYIVQRAVPGEEHYEEEYEYIYGKKLLEQKDSTLYVFLKEEEKSCTQIEAKLGMYETEAVKKRLVQLQKQRENREKALKVYEM